MLTKVNHLVLRQDLSRSLFTVLCAIVLHFFVSKNSNYGPYFCITALRLFVPYIAWVNIKECQGIYISLHVLSNRALTCSDIWKPLASVPWVLVYTSLLPWDQLEVTLCRIWIWDCILAGLLPFPFPIPPLFHYLASFPWKHLKVNCMWILWLSICFWGNKPKIPAITCWKIYENIIPFIINQNKNIKCL